MKHALVTTLALTCGVATTATAQIAQTNPEIAAELRALGATGPDVQPRTSELLGPLREAIPRDGVAVEQDVAYGPHERNVLDLYRPEETEEPSPILVFAHGGGYIRGDKSTMSNVGYHFASNGIVAAVINYRLAPDETWPAGSEDIARVIEWLKENKDSHGGDTEAIFLSGTSAGAGHVSGYVFNEELQVEDDGVIGAILIALPTVNLDREINPESGTAQYFGTDRAERAERSIINMLEGRELPLLLAVAENDLPEVHNEVGRLVQGLHERDERLPNLVTALGHNHYSISLHIGTEDEILSRHMREFIQATAAHAD